MTNEKRAVHVLDARLSALIEGIDMALTQTMEPGGGRSALQSLVAKLEADLAAVQEHIREDRRQELQTDLDLSLRGEPSLVDEAIALRTRARLLRTVLQHEKERYLLEEAAPAGFRRRLVAGRHE